MKDKGLFLLMLIGPTSVFIGAMVIDINLHWQEFILNMGIISIGFIITIPVGIYFAMAIPTNGYPLNMFRNAFGLKEK